MYIYVYIHISYIYVYIYACGPHLAHERAALLRELVGVEREVLEDVGVDVEVLRVVELLEEGVHLRGGCSVA